MLPKTHKLTWKTVNFLLRRRLVVHGRYFSIFFVHQYPNIPHSQRGFFVPKAIVKSAAKRNSLRRRFYQDVDTHNLQTLLSKKYRFFIRPNKRSEDKWLQLVAKWDKKLIFPTISRWLLEDIKLFIRKQKSFNKS